MPSNADRAERPRFATLRPVAEPSAGDHHARLRTFAQHLQSAGVKANMQLSLLTGPDTWSTSGIVVGTGAASVSKGALEAAHFEILTDEETWNAIVAGKLAPLEAMARKRMRVRGDTRLASAIHKRMAGSEGRTELCRSE